MRRIHLLALAAALLLHACDPQARPAAPPTDLLPYDFDQPSRSWDLPAQFAEISDLCLSGDQRLAFVIDEQASIYYFQPSTGKVDDSIHLPQPLDAEGLALKGDTFHILSGDGQMLRLIHGRLDTLHSPFSSRNNPEGLAWDARSGRFLIACKGRPLDLQKGTRQVYAATTTADSLLPVPFLPIHTGAIARHPAARGAHPKGDGAKNTDPVFQPSAVAVQPGSGHILVLSASTRLIALYDRGGTLLELRKLPQALLPKAEGIAFAPDGTLYLSTEAGRDGGVARIHAYTPATSPAPTLSPSTP